MFFLILATKATEEVKLLPTTHLSPEFMTDVLPDTTNVPRKNPTELTNDRTASVSKDDIEMMRGRALNINDSEHQRKSSGILYVTAPTTETFRPKSDNSFGGDGNRELSDVSMDDDEPFQTHLNKGELKLSSKSGKYYINLQFKSMFDVRCSIFKIYIDF